MSFSLTVLGSSSALPTTKRFPTAQILKVNERFFLIDCGEGTQIQLRRYGINLSKINHIFISHLHGDHVFGLFGLLSSFNLLGRKSPVNIYAHPDLQASIDHFKKYFGHDLLFGINFQPFKSNKEAVIYEDKHITVETIPLRHSVPCMGFVFREKKKLLNIKKDAVEQYNIGIREIRKIKEGADFTTDDDRVIFNKDLTLPPFKPRSYAFCTDTLYFSKLAESLKNVDILYYESTFSDKDKKLAKITRHSTALQAAKIAKEAHVGKLLMGHFSSRYKKTDELLKEAKSIFPESYAVEDGDVYSIAEQRVVEQVQNYS